MKNDPILVWRFNDAPIEYQELSTNGGDEDWLALVPKDMEIPMWLEDNTSFGRYCVDKFDFKEGVLLIGCHA